jgi:hypothetical protein
MEIGWTDVGSGGYILVLVFIFLFHAKIVIFYIHQNMKKKQFPILGYFDEYKISQFLHEIGI